MKCESGSMGCNFFFHSDKYPCRAFPYTVSADTMMTQVMHIMLIIFALEGIFTKSFVTLCALSDSGKSAGKLNAKFFLKFLEDVSPFFWITDTPVLDFR